MVRKTFEELIFDKKFSNLTIKEKETVKTLMFSGVYSFEDFIDLMKQIRVVTLEEAANIADQYLNPKLGAKIQNLDKESIEIDE